MTKEPKKTTSSIEECLVYIQNNLKVPKKRYNKFGGFSYRNASDILEALKLIIAQKGCSITLNDDIILVGERIYVKSVATLANESGSISTTAFAREENQRKGMDAAQLTGAASSYARKYALNGLLAIDDMADPDALNNNPEYTQSVKQSIDMATKAAENIKDRKDFISWWNAYPQLQQDKEFLAIAKKLGEKFPRAANKLNYESKRY